MNEVAREFFPALSVYRIKMFFCESTALCCSFWTHRPAWTGENSAGRYQSPDVAAVVCCCQSYEGCSMTISSRTTSLIRRQ